MNKADSSSKIVLYIPIIDNTQIFNSVNPPPSVIR